MKTEIQIFGSKSPGYPNVLRSSGEKARYDPIWLLGNQEILDTPLIGLFCSKKCPGDAIIKTYDLAVALREAKAPVIGGFHSPMEKECLDILLRGRQPIVICPARSIVRMRIPMFWEKHLSNGRLLVLSPFSEKHRRITAALSEQRNQFVASIGRTFFVPYASPNGRIERLSMNLIKKGKTIFAFKLQNDSQIVELGAKPLERMEIEKVLADSKRVDSMP